MAFGVIKELFLLFVCIVQCQKLQENNIISFCNSLFLFFLIYIVTNNNFKNNKKEEEEEEEEKKRVGLSERPKKERKKMTLIEL